MKAQATTWVSFCFAGSAAGLLYLANPTWVNGGETKSLVPKLRLEPAPISKDIKAATSFAPVIKKAAPSVVNVYTAKAVRDRMDLPYPPFYGDPWFRRFFGDNPPGDEEEAGPGARPRMERSLGSGVIVSEDGYILSNNHVIEGADEIKVALAEDKTVLEAKVVGTDPQTDIAVLKVESKEKLPSIAITDSDHLEVGDLVLAIGNPFGVGKTVTVGIVSALRRGGFDIVDYEDFIQTDASINPGSSGGALVDAEGRLVAINTAILSRSGGSQGVSFAVPINMARHVMERILNDGRVTRGYLGVSIQPVTPELAKEFGLPDQSGALVGGVLDDTPAAQAGLKEGDVVTEFNGQKVTDSRRLRLMVAQSAPHTKATLKVLRNGKLKTFTLTLEELQPEQVARAGPGRPAPRPKSEALVGVELGDIDAAARRQFEIPSNVRGALINNVDPGSPAYEAGLRPGDVILEINRQPVRDADEATELGRHNSGERVLLRLWSRGGSRYVVLDTTSKRRR